MENTTLDDELGELNDRVLALLDTQPSSTRIGALSPLHLRRMKWLQSFINNGDLESIQFSQPIYRRSEVWRCGFLWNVYYKNVQQNFAVCRKCNTLITYKSTLGVHQLMQHSCYKHHNNKANRNSIQELLNNKSPSIVFEYPTKQQAAQCDKLRNYLFLKQYNVPLDYLYCVLCKMAVYIQSHSISNYNSHIYEHELKCANKMATISPATLHINNNNKVNDTYRDYLKLLISTSNPAINLICIKRSDDKNSVWYYDLFRVIEHDGKRQNYLYCKMCAELVEYRVNEYPVHVLNHKCLKEMSDDDESLPTSTSSLTFQLNNDNKEKTEIVIDNEQDSIFEIRILDDGDENGGGLEVGDGNSELIEVNVNDFGQVVVDENIEPIVQPLEAPIPPLLLYPPEPHSVLPPLLPLEQSVQQNKTPLPPPLQQLSPSPSTPSENSYETRNKKRKRIMDEKPQENVEKNQQQHIEESTSPTNTLTQKELIHFDEKLKITKKILKFLQKTCLPIEINDESLKRLLQCLLNAGAAFGSFNLSTYWLNQSKIEYNLANHVLNINVQLKQIIKNEKLSFSCDMWEDLVDKTVYLTLRAHFIDDEFCLETIVLGTKSINSYNRKNSEWFIKSVIDILQQYYTSYQISLTQRRIATILLRDATCFVITKQEQPWQTPPCRKMLNCSATILNNIINKEFAENNQLKEFSQKMFDYLSETFKTNYLSSVKDLLKKRELRNNFHLSKWDTILSLLILYKNNIKQNVEEQQNEETQQNVNALFRILKVLKAGLQCLGNLESNIPTINTVCIVKQKLLSDLRILGGECRIFEELRKNLRAAIEKEFYIYEIHKIAAFLDPRFKALRHLSMADRLNIQEIVKTLIGNPLKPIRKDNNGTTVSSSTTKNNKLSSSTTTNKEQLNNKDNNDDDINSDDYLKEYMDDSIVTVEPVDNEIDVYVNLVINNNDKLSVLDFWKNHKELPKLRQLVRKILSIPASSNLEACTFSQKAINVIQKRSIQRGHRGNDLETAHMINGNLHVVSFEHSSLIKISKK